MYQGVSGDVVDLGRRLGLEELLDEGVLTSIVSTQTLADIQNKIVVRVPSRLVRAKQTARDSMAARVPYLSSRTDRGARISSRSFYSVSAAARVPCLQHAHGADPRRHPEQGRGVPSRRAPGVMRAQ